MDSVESELCSDLLRYRCELHELKRRHVTDSVMLARQLQLQRRIGWCEGWLQVLGVRSPQSADKPVSRAVSAATLRGLDRVGVSSALATVDA